MNIARMQQTSRALQDLARLVDMSPSGDVALSNSNLLRDANLVMDELWVELNRERAKCARLNRLMDNMHELFGPEEDASESQSNLESTQTSGARAAKIVVVEASLPKAMAQGLAGTMLPDTILIVAPFGVEIVAPEGAVERMRATCGMPGFIADPNKPVELAQFDESAPRSAPRDGKEAQ